MIRLKHGFSGWIYLNLESNRHAVTETGLIQYDPEADPFKMYFPLNFDGQLSRVQGRSYSQAFWKHCLAGVLRCHLLNELFQCTSLGSCPNSAWIHIHWDKGGRWKTCPSPAFSCRNFCPSPTAMLLSPATRRPSQTCAFPVHLHLEIFLCTPPWLSPRLGVQQDPFQINTICLSGCSVNAHLPNWEKKPSPMKGPPFPLVCL